MLAECCVFSKQSQPPGIFDPLPLQEHVSSRNEGVPSPEVTVPFCLVPSPEFSQAPWYSLPVYLCRFAVRSPGQLPTRLFLEVWDYPLRTTLRKCSPSRLGVNRSADLPTDPAYTLAPGQPSPGWATLLRPPFGQTLNRWFRNINRISIAYAFRPRLRYRLTLGRLALPRKP